MFSMGANHPALCFIPAALHLFQDAGLPFHIPSSLCHFAPGFAPPLHIPPIWDSLPEKTTITQKHACDVSIFTTVRTPENDILRLVSAHLQHLAPFQPVPWSARSRKR
jgi:hypothetical protein